jgi:hypothetical protein
MDNINRLADENAEAECEEIIVKADEVDEAGADISTIISNDDKELGARVEARRRQDLGKADPRTLANEVSDTARAFLRPILRRDGSAPPPPPPREPPPTPPAHSEDANATDSLSLAQLQRIVGALPKTESTAYAYEYADTRTIAEELEEWFQYSEEDKSLLVRAHESYTRKMRELDHTSSSSGLEAKWLALPPDRQESFVKSQLSDTQSTNAISLAENLKCLMYLALGAWKETAMLREDPPPALLADFEAPDDKYLKTVAQVRTIQSNAQLLCRLGAVSVLYELMITICNNDQYAQRP